MMRATQRKKLQVAKAFKPRNPVVAALAAQPGQRGAGVHEKSRGAKRRAEKMALAKEPEN